MDAVDLLQPSPVVTCVTTVGVEAPVEGVTDVVLKEPGSQRFLPHL